MRHAIRDKKGRFCKEITKCLGCFKEVDENIKVTFIDDTAKIRYIRGAKGDVFYILVGTEPIEGSRVYKRVVIDGTKYKAEETYEISEIL